MKYITSNGLTLEVREIGEVIYNLEIKNKRVPLPIIDNCIVSDEEARKICKRIAETKDYKRTT